MLDKMNLLLTKKDKIYIVLLIVISILVSICEIFSISMVMPFFAVVANPSLLHSNTVLNQVFSIFSFHSALEFIVVSSFLLMGLMIFRAFINTGYYYLLNKFCRTRYRTLANRLFKRYLDLSYLDFTKDSSSHLTQNMLIEANNFTMFLFGLLLMISEMMIIILIFSVLFIIDWRIALSITFVMVGMGLGVTRIVSGVVKNASTRRADGQNQLLRTMNETFGNFRFLKLLGNQNYVLDRFFSSSTLFIHAEAVFAMLSAIPKIIMETFGIIVLLSVLLVGLYLYHDPLVVIPILTMYLIAFFRLLPSINRIMTSWAQIRYYINSFDKVATEISRPVEVLGDEPITFERDISLDKVSFSYVQEKPVLRSLSLKILKGQRVAFFGSNGSGKSTCMDLVSGLLTPDLGQLFVDGVAITPNNVQSWRKRIGYIPQQMYLFEGTVKDNILCGRDEDPKKFDIACDLSGVLDFVSTFDSKSLWVGENGVQLSGGQKQRVAIARAIYDAPEIILLDEATSALDADSSQNVLYRLFGTLTNTTFIMVTHKEDHLSYCDHVFHF